MSDDPPYRRPPPAAAALVGRSTTPWSAAASTSSHTPVVVAAWWRRGVALTPPTVSHGVPRCPQAHGHRSHRLVLRHATEVSSAPPPPPPPSGAAAESRVLNEEYSVTVADVRGRGGEAGGVPPWRSGTPSATCGVCVCAIGDGDTPPLCCLNGIPSASGQCGGSEPHRYMGGDELLLLLLLLGLPGAQPHPGTEDRRLASSALPAATTTGQ